ncbi:hypothetical protein Smp_156960.1 [Schistosoma mansoni]|uniref:hypothetical protein n=1 Tax=Schistosoma mansoni TaxID=6183 RepID=UPI00022DBE97|nr:hypothetical protein Smp_156960.1 [Schistosoma mansoni]|eukprot:XP_018652719.1 hypothetical protein Smp_156960.1 [Schistosoma mansoni]
MEKIIREKFSNIPANRSVKIDLTRYRNSFDSPDFLKLYHVDSTRNKEQLRMVWAVPSVCTLYESNPVAVLAYFLSDKHPYGLENYLKNNHLATEVKCEFSAMSDFDNSTICALITICIDLNGTRPDLFKITNIVYEYLRFLSTKANEACINKNPEEDYQLTQKETFQCRTIFGPQETVIWIATMLHHTLPKDVHSAYLIIKTLDFQMYSELLDTLSKQQACLIHSLKLNPTIHKNIHIEKWYNLQYTQEVHEYLTSSSENDTQNYYKEFLKSVTNDATKEHFIQCKKLLIEELYNQLSDPNLIAENINSCLWYPYEYTASSLLNSLKYFTIADLMAFQTKYFYQMEIIMYIVGDVTCNLAKDLFTYTIGFFKCHPKSKETQHIDYITLQPGIYYYSVPNILNNEKFHQIIQFERIEQTSPVDEFYCKIITELLKSHAKQYFQHYESMNEPVLLDFYKLISNSFNSIIGTRLSLNSQLNKHDKVYLINCIQTFWNEIAPRVIACMDNNHFEQICNTIISNEIVKNNNLELISQFYWDKIKTNLLDGGINRKNMLKREMTREKLLEYFYKTYLNPTKKITIFVDLALQVLTDLTVCSEFSEHVYTTIDT